ncbi:MAG: methyltransferase domain-containing protein [Spirochaetes bacterium]|nr:methyltransferase domain-containing protein [Spirochaetota bacterium]HOD15813.1 methyltransferase domain-containing protein [Spirochaetota bacterium]HPG52232.1 methyltransferase domain-containing protein [Spirochaetota bacterium]
MKRLSFRWHYVALIIAAAVAMSLAGRARLHIDTDITKSLPVGDPVIADAEYVMMHHPVKDRIVIDCSASGGGADDLIDGASLVERKLSASGLFKSVGMDRYQAVFPELISYLMESLPALFTAQELEQKIGPLLAPDKVRETLTAHYDDLVNLGGIGQAGMIAADPLGFKNVILARMAHLAPSSDVQIVRGHLVSGDGKHLLITAEPAGSATDTALARRIAAVIASCRTELDTVFGPRGVRFTVTPVGAYRAALDNEDTAKEDSRMAVIFATIGIAVLLILGFPRPFLGLLALVPALLGTLAAAFVYSLFSDRISILALGFGGTMISFTVDYGIAYLLFLDRPHETRGMEATREVWSLGLLAMLTTALSFAFLFISGFSALAQIGYFTALGVAFTYIFVHALFPVVFPVMPPARRAGIVPLQGFVDRIMGSRPRAKIVAALLFFFVMLPFARPDFRVDLASMNTVTDETLAAEKLVTGVWGNVLTRVFLMTESQDMDVLQEKGDRLTALLDGEIEGGRLSSAFVPSMIFPGRERMAQNIGAWKAFWTPARIAALKRSLDGAARDTGFAPGAFDRFYKTLSRTDIRQQAFPERFHELLGVHRVRETGAWAQFSVLVPGPKYNAAAFHSGVSSPGLARLFDPSFFSERLGELLLSGFIKMAAIVGAVTVLVALLYLLDIRLTLIAMAPTLFSLVATLGSLKLAGEKPGISTIIVTVIVIGMGTDYALYIVRAYQRYRDESHPSLGLIRLTVFLSAASTMIGFGVLSLADHALLRNAGLTLLFGIGYSFLGTVLIVPPLLGRLTAPADASGGASGTGPAETAARVKRRYRLMEPYPRLFARFKLKFDPMFAELDGLIGSPGRVLDIGTGYGVPAAWVLECRPSARLFGIEPSPRRHLVAAHVVGDRGSVTRGSAPDLPELEGPADLALMLDMAHYLPDGDLSLLLERVRKKLSPGGLLLIRATVPMRKQATALRLIEAAWARAHGLSRIYRDVDAMTALMRGAGFTVEVRDSANASREEKWFLCRAQTPGRKRPSRPKKR